MELINRQAIVVRPAQPFVDWIHRVDEQLGKGDDPLDDELIRGTTNVYLIREFDSPDESKKYIRRRAVELLEEELGSWITDPDLWPQDRDREMFDRWMEWELHEIVSDVEDSAIEHQGFSIGSL